MRCVGADDVPQRMDLFVRRPALLLLVNRYFRVKRSTTWCAELRFWRDHDLQNGPRDVCFQAEAKCAATADMRGAMLPFTYLSVGVALEADKIALPRALHRLLL